MGNGDFKILLQALLDDSSLTDIEKKLAKKKINVGLDLDFANSIKESEKQIGELAKRFKAMFNFKTDTEAMSFTKKYLSEANKLISQNEQKIKQAEKDERAEIRKTASEINKKNQAREKANAQNAKVRTSNANSILTEEIQSLNKIADLRSKIVSNSSKDNTSQVSVLKEELALEQSHYDRLRSESSLYADIISNEERRKVLKDASLQSELKVQQAQAKVTDTATLQAEKAETAELEKQATLIAKIKSYQSGTAKGTSLETDYLSVEKSYQSYEKLGVVTDKLKADFAELKVAKNALDTSSDANLITNSEKWNTALATVNNTLKQTKLNMQSIPASADEISNAIAKVTNYMVKNTAMDKAAKTQMQGFITTLKSGDVSKEWISQMNADLTTTDARLRSAGKLGLSFFDKMKAGFEKFGGWSIISGLFVKGTQAVKSMFNNVVDLDTAMTNLYKVTDETDSSYNKFLDNATEKAKKLGATITDFANSSAEFAKLGYSLDDASKLAEVATIYKNVGDIDITSATESIVSTMKAFGYSADEAMAIIDKFNEVGNNFAISSSDIGEALQRSASSLVVGGNSLDEAIALITAGNTITQDADSVGTALKTASLRITSTTAELEEMGESTEYACETLSDYRNLVMGLTHNKVDILGSDGNYKSTYEILQGISKVWKDMNSMEQSSLLKSLFGTRQANIGASIIEQFSTAEEVLESSLGSTGSAVTENEKQLESIKGKAIQFKASVEELSKTLINSDLIKFFVDFGTGATSAINSVVDALGGIPLALGAIGTAVAQKSGLD